MVSTFVLLLVFGLVSAAINATANPIFFAGVDVPFHCAGVGCDFGVQNSTGQNVGIPVIGDFYEPDYFQSMFVALDAINHRVAGIQVHFDGRTSPVWDPSSGAAIGLPNSFLTDLQDFCGRALNSSTLVILQLWADYIIGSCGACDPSACNGVVDQCGDNVGICLGWGGGSHSQVITNATATQSYIDNALIPLLNAVKPYSNVLAIDILAYIDGSGFSNCIAPVDQQRFIGMIASAIHRNSPVLATITGRGIQTFVGAGSLWHDASLQAATGGDPNAYLDFYTSTFWSSQELNPFNQSAASFGLDKPTLISTHKGVGNYNDTELVQLARAGGYLGLKFFSWNNVFSAETQAGGEIARALVANESSFEAISRWASLPLPTVPTPSVITTYTDACGSNPPPGVLANCTLDPATNKTLSIIVVTQPLVINGSLSLSGELVIKDASTPIVVSDCVNVSGNLNITLVKPPANDRIVVIEAPCFGNSTFNQVNVTKTYTDCKVIQPDATKQELEAGRFSVLLSQDSSKCPKKNKHLKWILVGAGCAVAVVLVVTAIVAWHFYQNWRDRKRSVARKRTFMARKY